KLRKASEISSIGASLTDGFLHSCMPSSDDAHSRSQVAFQFSSALIFSSALSVSQIKSSFTFLKFTEGELIKHSLSIVSSFMKLKFKSRLAGKTSCFIFTDLLYI